MLIDVDYEICVESEVNNEKRRERVGEEHEMTTHLIKIKNLPMLMLVV